MNIVVVSGGIPSVEDPLSGIFSFDQALALKKYGHNVAYLAIDLRSVRRKRKFGYYSGEKDGIKYACASIPVGAVSIEVRNFLGSHAIIKLYKKFYSTFHPDIIHAHFNEMGSISIKLANTLNIPLIITEHSSELSAETIKQSHLRSIKKAYNGSSQVIAVSKALADSIKKHTGIDAVVINNMINTDLFTVGQYLTDGLFNVVHVGNLVSIKNQRMLLDAFYLLHKQLPESKLYIAGTGPLEMELKEKVSDLDLCSSVVFMGRLSRGEIAELLRKASVFAFTSKSETFGVACVEALAVGVPVVTTDCGGPNEFISDSNGIIVDSNNPKEFARSLVQVYKNPEKYDRISISKEIKAKFSETAIVNKLNLLYIEVIGQYHNRKSDMVHEDGI